MEPVSQIRAIALPRARLRRLAKHLIRTNGLVQVLQDHDHTIKVVCISDTHNHQPPLPEGDLLLHAGDLTEWGSFDEVQKQLTWLASQPHEHKVIIAGNHDILFDPVFLRSEAERFPQTEGKTIDHLDFGTVQYLQDASVTLTFSKSRRRVTIYGSPWTPQYVKSAFQYPQDCDIWSEKIPKDVDILLTHGPPFGHLDGWRRAGCQYLAQAVEQRRPRLVVFGHIHVGRGQETVRYNSLRRLYEDIERGWRGWEAIPPMLALLAWKKLRYYWSSDDERATQLVNAAIVGDGNQPCNAPIVTTI